MQTKRYLSITLIALAMLSLSCVTITQAIPFLSTPLSPNQAMIPVDFSGTLILRTDDWEVTLLEAVDVGDSIGGENMLRLNIKSSLETTHYLLRIKLDVTNLTDNELLIGIDIFEIIDAVGGEAEIASYCMQKDDYCGFSLYLDPHDSRSGLYLILIVENDVESLTLELTDEVEK